MEKKYTRQQLEEALLQEINKLDEKCKKHLMQMDEGFLDRVLSKARGNVAQLKGLGQNISKVGGAITKGGDLSNLKDPRVAKGAAIASRRLELFQKKLNAITVDLMSDLETLFGEDLQNSPNKIKGELDVWAQTLQELGQYTKKVQGQFQQISNGVSRPELVNDLKENKE